MLLLSDNVTLTLVFLVCDFQEERLFLILRTVFLHLKKLPGTCFTQKHICRLRGGRKEIFTLNIISWVFLKVSIEFYKTLSFCNALKKLDGSNGSKTKCPKSKTSSCRS